MNINNNNKKQKNTSILPTSNIELVLRVVKGPDFRDLFLSNRSHARFTLLVSLHNISLNENKKNK